MLLLFTSSCASSSRSDLTDNDGSFSFALIGDMPYASWEVDQFKQLMQEINTDPELEWVLHAGDIKTGAAPCSDEYLSGRLALFQQFEIPFILTPGDNEWTDCHRATAGGYLPLERLQKLRMLFYPEPGHSLGLTTLQMETQASDPNYAEFPEHVRWMRSGVVFAALHIVGSRNAMAPFSLRTEADDEEAERRMLAAIQWMQDAFALAHRSKSPGVFLIMHANPGFMARPGQQVYKPFLEALERETIRLAKPVVLTHGDSHYFRIDKPLVSSYAGRRIENFTRVETFGGGDVHWLRVTVKPDDANVFAVEQKIVPQNLERHILPD